MMEVHPDLRKGEDIKLQGRKGTWYVVFTEEKRGQTRYYLESEQYGDMADMVVVDQNKNVLIKNYR